MTEFLKALFLIFIAEMGDKTQIIAMTFATKFKVREVLIGVTIGVVLNHGIAVIVGAKLGQYLPMDYIQIFAGFLFLYFGVMSLKRENDDEEKDKKGNYGPILAVAMAFFIGEMGDKTQLTAMTLATDSAHPLIILMGTTAGMVLTSSFGIFVGSRLGKKISEFALKTISSFVFLLFGTIKLFESLPANYINSLNIVLYFAILLIIEAFMLKPWIAEKKEERVSRYKTAAEKLRQKRINIRKAIKKSCKNEVCCETCENNGCLLSYVNKVLKAAENDEELVLNANWENLPKSGENYNREKLIESLKLIIEYYEEEGWIEEENHIINRTRESLEILTFGNKLKYEKGLDAYLLNLKQNESEVYKKIKE